MCDVECTCKQRETGEDHERQVDGVREAGNARQPFIDPQHYENTEAGDAEPLTPMMGFVGLVALVAYAWIDGGTETVHEITVDLPLPGGAQ